MDNVPPQQKKGLGALGWIGIGCGGIIVLGIIAVAAIFMFFGKDLKEFGEQAGKNPTRAGAMAAVKMSFGKLELVAEDDANKRYTLKEKDSGKLITMYWDEKTGAPKQVEGDFSAIPADANTPAP